MSNTVKCGFCAKELTLNEANYDSDLDLFFCPVCWGDDPDRDGGSIPDEDGYIPEPPDEWPWFDNGGRDPNAPDEDY